MGREQAGHRPALVLSANLYNRRVGLAVVCPITNQKKGYVFEVDIPEGVGATGVVMADQIKSVDWEGRGATYRCRMPEAIVAEVLDRAIALIERP